jgi:hypothetical protein
MLHGHISVLAGRHLPEPVTQLVAMLEDHLAGVAARNPGRVRAAR